MNRHYCRADLYRLLAECLSGSPDWFELPVVAWPLYQVVSQLASCSAAAARAVTQLAQIPAEAGLWRRERYGALFIGQSEPRFWLYETMYREGSILGHTTHTVRRIYQAAGLEVVGAELPDHASMELSFLSFLAKQQAESSTEATAWGQLERRFIRRHAGCWLPQLGRELAASGDIVYAPIGVLLAEWLDEAIRPKRRAAKSPQSRIPVMRAAEACTLCGFCVQVCPTKALAISESELETSLLLQPQRCISCRRCIDICASEVLSEMSQSSGWIAAADIQVMHSSERVICPGCGVPTFSLAELDFVRRQVGQLDWLNYCQTCRQALSMELS